MNTTSLTAFRAAVDRAYEVFGRYTYAGRDFCTFCRTDEEISRLISTPLRDLNEEQVRSILWESWDHWESSEVFKHYLPRALEGMGPPLSIADMFPSHLPNALLALRFKHWPEEEQQAVLNCLAAVTPYLDLSHQSDREEWQNAISELIVSGG